MNSKWKASTRSSLLHIQFLHTATVYYFPFSSLLCQVHLVSLFQIEARKNLNGYYQGNFQLHFLLPQSFNHLRSNPNPSNLLTLHKSLYDNNQWLGLSFLFCHVLLSCMFQGKSRLGSTRPSVGGQSRPSGMIFYFYFYEFSSVIHQIDYFHIIYFISCFVLVFLIFMEQWVPRISSFFRIMIGLKLVMPPSRCFFFLSFPLYIKLSIWAWKFSDLILILSVGHLQKKLLQLQGIDLYWLLKNKF